MYQTIPNISLTTLSEKPNNRVKAFKFTKKLREVAMIDDLYRAKTIGK